MQEQLNRMEKKLDEVCKILNGNGEMGLCAKVSMLWKERTSWMKWSGWVIQILILCVLGWLGLK